MSVLQQSPFNRTQKYKTNTTTYFHQHPQSNPSDWTRKCLTPVEVWTLDTYCYWPTSYFQISNTNIFLKFSIVFQYPWNGQKGEIQVLLNKQFYFYFYISIHKIYYINILIITQWELSGQSLTIPRHFSDCLHLSSGIDLVPSIYQFIIVIQCRKWPFGPTFPMDLPWFPLKGSAHVTSTSKIFL